MDIKETAAISAAPADGLPDHAKSFWRRFRNFSREIWDDHDFWIRTLAVKGGASAVVVACMVAVSHIVALPFFLAAAGIAACVGVVAIGLYGIFLGGTTAWNKLKGIYSKTFSGNTQKPRTQPKKFLYQKLLENSRIKRLTEKPLVQKFINSRAWRMTESIARKQQDMFLTGLAGGGSVFLGTLSALTLVTQIALLPVIAVGGLVTLTTVIATGGVLSGAYGIYLSGQKLLQSFRAYKKPKTEQLNAAEAPPSVARQHGHLTAVVLSSLFPQASTSPATGENPETNPQPPEDQSAHASQPKVKSPAP